MTPLLDAWMVYAQARYPYTARYTVQSKQYRGMSTDKVISSVTLPQPTDR